jgi:hypothetical protein
LLSQDKKITVIKLYSSILPMKYFLIKFRFYNIIFKVKLKYQKCERM